MGDNTKFKTAFEATVLFLQPVLTRGTPFLTSYLKPLEIAANS